jgi:hypothetical protein
MAAPRLAALLAYYHRLSPAEQRAFRQAIATPRTRRPRKAARDALLARLRAEGVALKCLGAGVRLSCDVRPPTGGRS